MGSCISLLQEQGSGLGLGWDRNGNGMLLQEQWIGLGSCSPGKGSSGWGLGSSSKPRLALGGAGDPPRAGINPNFWDLSQILPIPHPPAAPAPPARCQDPAAGPGCGAGGKVADLWDFWAACLLWEGEHSKIASSLPCLSPPSQPAPSSGERSGTCPGRRQRRAFLPSLLPSPCSGRDFPANSTFSLPLSPQFMDCFMIGRDLVRLLQNVARIPEFEQLWKDILHNPQVLSSQFTGTRPGTFPVLTQHRFPGIFQCCRGLGGIRA